MDTLYVTKRETFVDIADNIRRLTKTTEPIRVVDFGKIIGNFDLSTEEYMAIVDMGATFSINTKHPTYTDEEIQHVDNYIKYYGGELNG